MGIKTPNPKIHLAIGQDHTGLNLQGDNGLAVYTYGKEHVRINHFGHVGIGTSAPSAELHIKSDGYLKIGNTQIGEKELNILQKLANNTLEVYIRSPKGYYLDNYDNKEGDGDNHRTIQFRSGKGVSKMKLNIA